MKIPSHAKQVFKGIIIDVYQWEQELFDGSTATFEALKRPYTIQIIPIVGDKLLLAREEQPLSGERMTHIGGRQEQGKTPLETAKRELLEETGLASDEWELLRTYEPSGKIDWKVFLFVARDCKKLQAQNLDAGEKIELVELDFGAFVKTVSDADFWEEWSSNEVYRAKQEGKLDEYHKELFGN